MWRRGERCGRQKNGSIVCLVNDDIHEKVIGCNFGVRPWKGDGGMLLNCRLGKIHLTKYELEIPDRGFELGVISVERGELFIWIELQRFIGRFFSHYALSCLPLFLFLPNGF